MMVRKATVLFIFLFIIGKVAMAQLTANGAGKAVVTQYTNVSPNDTIYIFCGIDANGNPNMGSLTATPIGGMPNYNFDWQKFNPNTYVYDPYANTNGLTSLSTRLGLLEQTVSASTSAFENSSAITNLITNLNSRLNDFVAGKSSLSTSYDLAPFRSGQGISLDKTIPKQLTITSTVQAYSKVSEINLKSNTSNTFTTPLAISNTYIKHSNESVFSLSSDFDIRIDNSLNSWKNGQVLKLVFDSQIIPNNYNIKIKTRADNNYSVTIATLTSSDFPISYGRTGRPIIEITCINSQNFTFQVDKIIR